MHKSLMSNASEGRMLDVETSLVVSAGDMAGPRARVRKILGHFRVVKQHVKNLDKILNSGKTVVWLVPSGFVGQVIGGGLASLPDELKSVCLASRMFGGFIAHEEWIAACEEMHPILHQVPQPIARLEAAIKTPREFAIDASVGGEAAWATNVLFAADGFKNPASQWIIRERKAIKKDLEAFVLFPNEEHVARDAETKKAVNAKVIKHRATLSACTTEFAKTKAKAKLKATVARSKTLRGIGVTLENFACTLANFA